MPNITVRRCTTLNAATLLPTEGDGEEHHCCLTTLEQVCTPRPDLSDMPFENCDNVLFVDGSASKDPQTGQNKSDGRPILNARLVAELLEAILLPEKIAICKCAAHTNNKDSVSIGNARADAAAKAAATQQTEEPECTLLSETNENTSSSLQGMQTFATGAEKELWKKCGCKVIDGVWRTRGVKLPLVSQPPSTGPFEYLQMDFVELNPCEGNGPNGLRSSRHRNRMRRRWQKHC
ncbi:hypothetical protein QQF64_004535 [Cirrhinus molitorella]|uniref:RNase H type-1 domain-containing protein n=1 Tax=Cirrhinus molitorella TaxID=172907 RepID=A0ABR3MGS3_9TELE